MDAIFIASTIKFINSQRYERKLLIVFKRLSDTRKNIPLGRVNESN